MMRSLYSGVSGLRNHQTRMDVIGNNIANVNTVGFKGSRVIFQDLFSQTTKAGSGQGVGIGGTNPQQVGLGVATATIDIMQTRTATQYTGSPLDLAIEGDGFFQVEGNGMKYYTRAGNFYWDENNQLVNGDGFYLQVVPADTIQTGTGGLPVETIDGKDYTDTSGATTFTLDGDKFTQVNIDKNGIITAIAKDDDTSGANYKAGDKVTLGAVVIGNFANQNALEKVGSNLYLPTNNSGQAELAAPGQKGAGTLNPGTLEMSNVDLSNEFTDMIITQRGFQANSRIITVSDSMLEELVNLKR